MATKKAKVELIKQNVGVDMSKVDFKCCFYNLDRNGRRFIAATRTFKNTLAGFVGFMKWIEKKRNMDLELRITMEATGVYHENLVYFLDDNGYYVSVVLANQSNAFAKSLNQTSKTDKLDAAMLGQFGIERDLRQWQPTSAKIRELKQLTRDRASIIEEKTALGNKLHALQSSFNPGKTVIKRLKQRIALLYKQKKEVEKQIKALIQADEIIKRKVENICKVKGLGAITVATIIAETDGFALFTSRGQVISYAGYDIVERESGSSIKGKTRISKRGNSHIRRALHFPAITAVKYEEPFQQLFDRVLDKSGIKMKGYVAVQRKLLILVYTLFKNDAIYDPNYQKNKENTKKERIQISRQDTNPAYAGCSL